MNPAFETLLQAAILAPSGDNMQPWHFVVDEKESIIEIHVDAARDRSPMNAGQRMARIACGAALENIVRTAAHNDWPIAIEDSDSSALAIVRLLESSSRAGTIDPVVTGRVTNRQFYDASRLDNSHWEKLQEMRTINPNLRFHWVAERGEIERCARIVGEADAMMFGIQSMRQAFLENIRFDLPADAAAAEGLPLGTLGLGIVERCGLKGLRYLPQPIVKYGGVLRSFRRRAAALVKSSSGVIAILAQGESAEIDLGIGRTFEQVWLTLGSGELAVQPMMSLPVLECWGAHSARMATEASLSQKITALADRARTELQIPAEWRIAALVRFGVAPNPPIRTARRDLQSCVTMRETCDEQAIAALA